MANFLHSESADDLGKLLIRLALGGTLIFHGISKLMHGVAWMREPLANFGLPAFVAYGAYLAEIVAPILIVLGILTRPAALVVAFDLFMAIVLVLRGHIFEIKQGGGGWAIELEVIIILMALSLFFAGAGKFSVMGKRSSWN